MLNGVSPKVGIYFTHYECFGPASRVMAVGEIVKKRFPQGSLFFMQAGLLQPSSCIEKLGEVSVLPKTFMDRRNFKEPVHLPAADAIKRGQECERITASRKLDLLITENFPLGHKECCHELMPSLLKASAQGTAVWAVTGWPMLTGEDHQWRDEVLKYYQRIIIFSPASAEEAISRQYPDFFDKYASKITFAGYLLPEQEVVHVGEDAAKNIHNPPVPKGACRVCVVRGSGAVDPKMIAQAIRASDLLGKDYYLTVIAGPSTTAQEWYLFGTLAAQKKIKNMALLRIVGDYEGLIENHDCCVCEAGYHTSVMLLKHQKKAVLIPFAGQGSMVFHEQPALAVMLKELIGARILSSESLTAETMAEAIRTAAAGPGVKTSIPREWFTGAAALDRALAEL